MSQLVVNIQRQYVSMLKGVDIIDDEDNLLRMENMFKVVYSKPSYYSKLKANQQ